MARARYVLLAAAFLATACHFERRPDLPADDAAQPREAPAQGGLTVEDSVRGHAAAIEDALRTGDVARVALLSVPGATLIDQEEAVRWTLTEPEAPLPQALAGRGDGFDWQLSASRFVDLDGTALLVNEYQAVAVSDGTPWQAAETLLLVRTPAGWRLTHLHRSRGPRGGGV